MTPENVGTENASEAEAIRLDSVICQAKGRPILDVTSLVIRQGERVAIIGHNGAGKSTLLRMLSGFVIPTRGTVNVLGRRLNVGTTRSSPSALRSLRAEIGHVMQGLHLVHRLSALDNVLIGCLGRRRGWRTWARYYTPEDISEAESALNASGILSRAEMRVDRLSGGERQKVALARMLMQHPRLILADEPTAALDPQAATEICSLLANAANGLPIAGNKSAPATLVTVVHNPVLLPLLADRVIGLKHGKIAFDLPIVEVDDASLLLLYRMDQSLSAINWITSDHQEQQRFTPEIL